MNKVQVKGNVKEAVDKVQAQAGKVAGSTERQTKGRSREVDGRAQHAIAGEKNLDRSQRC